MSAITIIDLNNAQLDVNTIASVATSTAPTVTDRLGNVKKTIAGMSAQFLNAGIYATPAAGLTATTSGQYFTSIATDNTAYLILYLNSAGAAVEQKRYPATAYVTNATQLHASEIIGRALVADGAIFKVQGVGTISSYEYRRTNAAGSVLVATYPALSATTAAIAQIAITNAVAPTQPVVASVYDAVSGRYAPFMTADGRLAQTLADGTLVAIAGRGEELLKNAPFYGLISGERPWKVKLGSDDRVQEAWTLEGSYFVAGPTGLARVGINLTPLDARVPYVTTSADTPLYGINTRLSVRTDNVRYIVITMGQSNGLGGASTGLPVIAGTPIYPNDALMRAGNTPRVVAGGATTFVPCLEALADSGEECATTSWVTHTIRDTEALTGQRIKMVGMNACQGGTPLRGLKRGSYAYKLMVLGLQEVANICRAQGATPIVLAIDWMQGEDESSSAQKFTPKDIERQLLTLKRDVVADCSAITGQREQIAWFNTQVAVCQFASPFYAPVRQAHVNLDGQEGMRLAGPLYQFPTGTGIQIIHANNVGQNRRGQMLGRATVTECFGTGWKSFSPTVSRFVSTTQVDIEMQAQTYPLVLDTSGSIITTANITAGLGFIADDRSGTAITVTAAVVQPDGATVRLTLSRASTATTVRIGYALQNDSDGAYGPVNGGRGCLRDSATGSNVYSGIVQQNWANAFAIEVKNP